MELELEKLKESGEEIWIAGKVNEELVKKLESELNLMLPNSYREFLLKFGAIGVNDRYISGITCDDLDEGGDSVLFDTTYFREDYGLPSNLIIIESNEDAPYCMDMSPKDEEGEFRIVCYEIRSGSIHEIANNFQVWINKFFLCDLIN